MIIKILKLIVSMIMIAAVLATLVTEKNYNRAEIFGLVVVSAAAILMWI